MKKRTVLEKELKQEVQQELATELAARAKQETPATPVVKQEDAKAKSSPVKTATKATASPSKKR